MRSVLFLMAPSDIEGQNLTKKEYLDDGRVSAEAVWAGLLPIRSFIEGDETLSAKSRFLLMGIHEKFRIPRNLRPNLFNLVGDADASVTALRIIQDMENKIQPQRCFNRAGNVFKTARERLPETLSDIPGCRVPRVKSLNPESYSELEKACDEFGAWPLIVRARGYHGGEKMILLSDKSQLQAIRDDQWLYGGILLMEFVDYRNSESLYQKTRVILVDGVPYPRHSIISDRCFIHSDSRSGLMGKDLELCRQEERFLAYMRDTGMKKYGGIFNAVQERIGLDIFGVDFGVVDGEIVVFEANACMNFLTQDYGKDGRYLYLKDYVKDLKRAVKRMLMKA